jgi:3-methyl-2-oxobutanoate hydroxymethyltransferase
MLGITPGKRPRFSKDFLAGGNTVRGAIESFRRDVKNGAFPSAEHSFQ